MGQAEVMELLEKMKEPLSRTDIANILKENTITVSHALQRLISYNEVKVIEISGEQALVKYKCKKRMRLYYVVKD